MVDVRSVFEYGLAFFTIFLTVFFLLLFFVNRGGIARSPKPPKKLPTLTILIPAYNEEETIAKTIESVLEADYAPGRKKVIVIDDGSSDGTLEVAGKYARKGVLVLHQANKGKAAALNYGLEHVKTELVASMDADSFIEKDALMKIVGFFSDPEVGAVTSVLKVWQPKSALEKLQRLEYLSMTFVRRLLSSINSINVTPGPLSMFRKKVFDEVGGFDVDNILEDQEIAYRIQAHNYKIESSMDAVVHTVVPASISALARQRVRWQRGGLRNIIKYHYLVGPRYGDFGMLIMPLAIFSVFVVFMVLLYIAYSAVNNSLGDMFRYGLDALVLGVRPLNVLSLIIFLGSVVWVVIGMRQLKGEALSPFWLFTYLVVYAPLITLFWIATAVKEIKRERLKW